MTAPYRLETVRVVLRQWRSDDYEKFASMNADPDVMRYFPTLLSREESDKLTKKFENLIAIKGWGFWVAQRKSDNAFLGLVGLNYADDLPLNNCLEVGWRLAKTHWGKGYATEAAAASLHFAFSKLDETSVSAFTTVKNAPSRRVMTRLGMKDREKNFLHPRVLESSGMKEHVHYKISREDFYREFLESSVDILLE